MIGKVQQDSFQSLRIQIDGFSSQLSEPFGSSFGLGSSLGDSLSSLDKDCPSGHSRVLGRSQSQTSPTSSLKSPGAPPCTVPATQTSRYKTEMCRTFEENGTCKYGEKCQFAHGPHEIRTVSRHPKYKTDLCRTYHSVGFCPYGPRCHFIHALDEMRSQPIMTTPEKKGNGPVKQLPMFGGSGNENSPPWTLPTRNNEKSKQADMESAVNQLNKYFNMSANLRPALSPSSLDSSRSGSCSDTSSLPSSSPPPENGFCSSPRRPLFDRPSFAWHSHPKYSPSYYFLSFLSPLDHDHPLFFSLFFYNQLSLYFQALQMCLTFLIVQIIKTICFNFFLCGSMFTSFLF